jgi:hypothetical protein
MKEVIKGDKKINNMKILRIEDYNYSIVYVENENEYSVYKRFVDGKWMYLKRDNWLTVKNVDELEKISQENKND